MTFDQALIRLRAGECVARTAWAQGNMFLYLVPGRRFHVDRQPLAGIYPVGAELHYRPHIDQRQSDGTHAPWIPTSTDLLAADWVTGRW